VTVMEIPLRITDNRTKPNLQKLLFGLFRQVVSTRHNIIGGRNSRAPTKKILLNPAPSMNPTTEEINTTIEFYDSTQRTGLGRFIYGKEKYSVAYLMTIT